MKISTKMKLPALLAMAIIAAAPYAQGAIITGWAVHNGTSIVGGTPAAPTFTAADNITAMAPFDAVTLGANGDEVTVSTTATVTGRSGGVGVNTLNTQLRVGLFNGPAGAIVASDIPNVGFIIEYSNVAAGGLIREQQSAVQTNPFTSPTNLGNGVQDAGADSIQGANPGPVTLTLTLKRNGASLDLSGSISGTDAVSGNPYSSTYSLAGIAASNYTFNRIGLFLGDNVNGASATLTNSTVTTNVPEPSVCILAACASIGGMALGRRASRATPRALRAQR